MTRCTRRPDAAAFVRGNEDHPRLWGEVCFYQKSRGVWVVVHIYGLPQTAGFLGFHIHEGSSCGGSDFASTGGHFNPMSTLHPDHAGDLPPLLNCDGEGYLAVLTNRFRVDDVLQKTVVIHDDADDFHSQPSGNAGKKIACGVIYTVPGSGNGWSLAER